MVTPSGTGENGIMPDSPKSTRRLRAVEPAEAKNAQRIPKRPPTTCRWRSPASSVGRRSWQR